MNKKEHLTPHQLLGYANDSLDCEEEDIVGRHLLLCEECRKLLPRPTKEQFLKAVLGERKRRVKSLLISKI